MGKFVNDPRVGINYIETRRFYCIDLIYSAAIQGISHCPFCGHKLPPDLWDRYFNILEKEYNIDDPDDEEKTKDLPKEFKSDAWWKKRGL